MRRMYSKSELKQAIQKEAQSLDKLAVKEEAKVFESMTDKNGHKRFIEGDITINTITGLTQKYGKWSLSGTHLLIVLACEIANETVLTSQFLASVNIPKWILNKIYPIFSTNVMRTNVSCWAENYTSQSLSINLIKDSTNLKIQCGGLTLTATRNFRIQFDLLIDNAK